MNNKKVRRAGYVLASALLAGTGATGTAVSAVQQPQVQQFSFTIPAKPLTQAVNEIGRIAGLSVVFPEDTAIEGTGRPVQGRMSVKQALTILLSGTGMGYSFSNDSTVQIYRLPPELAADASTIVVIASANGRLGPVNGYVASNSTAGTKTNTPLMKNPQSVSVITRDQVDMQGAQNLTQTLRYSVGSRRKCADRHHATICPIFVALDRLPIATSILMDCVCCAGAAT
ncbi:hypothetical protein ACQFN5_06665 [Klebsiella sp. WOUb02]|uniref:STN domain-containing protein n=1 Tax=Klebsiella sp. WOUb02 TaxID=3161071 RepID=UPI003CF88A80